MRARRIYLVAFGGLLALGAYIHQPTASLQAAEPAMTSDAATSLVIDVLNRRPTGGCQDCQDTTVPVGAEQLDFHRFYGISEELAKPLAADTHLEDGGAPATVSSLRDPAIPFVNRRCYVDIGDAICHDFWIEGDCDSHDACTEMSAAVLQEAKLLGRSKNFAGLMRAVKANPRLSIDVDNAVILVADCSGRVAERIPLQSSLGAALRQWRVALS